MRTIYTEFDNADILQTIENYIEQCENDEEKQAYRMELYDVRNNFMELVGSGVFHDAMGKPLEVKEVWGVLQVEVETEY